MKIVNSPCILMSPSLPVHSESLQMVPTVEGKKSTQWREFKIAVWDDVCGLNLQC